MKARIAVVSLFLAVCSATGFAQTARPSISIGTHVLTLGMPEPTVLEELGSDFELQSISGSTAQTSSWMVTKRVGSLFKPAGEVAFTGHKLTTAIRYWDIENSSSKSLFYAIDEATMSIESDGLTDCQISGNGASQMVDAPSGEGSGTLSTQVILIDCGIKKIRIDRFLSDTPRVAPSGIEASEWLQNR